MFNIDIIENELIFSATRSRGPGGQNVNKVSSAAILTWDYSVSCPIKLEQKLLIREKLQSHINRNDLLFIRSDEFRDFDRNKNRCREKLALLLERAFHKDKPRKATKPTRASKLRRKNEKKRRSEIKSMRRKLD